MRLLLLNGPNLNLLGTRRPEVYGSTTLAQVEEMFVGWAAGYGAVAQAFQSNHEGALIDAVHAARDDAVDGIVFNPGAYTHTSYALHDAIESVEIPTVEVHISNVEEREPWRRISMVRPACVYTIYGRGVDGYRWGLRHLVARVAWPVTPLRYGDHPDQCADLRLPEGRGPFRMAVIVHGGFWRHMWTRDTTDLVAVDLTRRGVASLNVEYRRVGTGGVGAAPVEDVVAAVTAALDRPDIDPTAWAITGHSAGGQLALVAAHRMASEGHAPKLAVTMGGVSDLEVALSEDLGAGAVAAYLDGAAQMDLSPVALMPIGVPVMAAHGTADDRVPIDQAERLVAASAGTATLAAIDGAGHFDHLEPDHLAWTSVADRITAALGR